MAVIFYNASKNGYADPYDVHDALEVSQEEAEAFERDSSVASNQRAGVGATIGSTSGATSSTNNQSSTGNSFFSNSI